MKSPNSNPLSREEIANIEAGHTTISRRLASLVTVVFLGLILTTPVLQHLHDVKAYLIGERNTPWPQCLDMMTALGELPSVKDGDGVLQTVLDRNAFLLNRINTYEDRLENRSILTKSLLGPGQEFLTRFLGAGNEKAYQGKGRWLYYRPDVDYVMGPSFLDERVLERKALAGTSTNPAPQPDPLPAIIDFHRQLSLQGVELVLVPVPAKSGIVPEPLAGKPQSLPIQNPSFDEFKERIAEAGVALFDPAPLLVRQFEMSQIAPYLVADTHWTPDGMDVVAKGLAAFLKSRYFPSEAEVPLYSRTPVEQTAAGDIAAMLKLPEGSTLFADQTVTVQQVHLAEEVEKAEILLLGDSFVNIYSAKELGWGEHAGLAEQLAFHLQRPIDRLARNDNASYATREMLRDEWTRGKNPLHGKKVVVWEFAVRELASGDWRVLELQSSEFKDIQETPFLIPKAGEEIVVDATVIAVSEIPVPGSVPYRDHICMVHFKNIEREHESVAFMRSMQDNKLAQVADWQPGSQVKVRMRPWSDVFDQYGTMNQSELDGFPLLDAYGWAEPMDHALTRRTIPVGLMAYAGGLILMILLVCRNAKDRLLRISIGLIGLVWVVAGVVILGSSSAPAQDESVGIPPEAKEPLPPVNLSKATFQEYCSSTAAQAEQDGRMVVRGVDDWLFLRSELHHMGINKFWGESAVAVSKASNPEYADPLPGILDFHAQLKEAGVDLWIVPVPPKVAIYPDKLAAGYTAAPRLDSSHQEFYDLLKKEGIEVIDMTSKFLAERMAGSEALYCRQDSHWAEQGMELLADELFRRIGLLPWYEQMEKETFLKTNFEQEITGDLWQMLGGSRPLKERVQLSSVKSEATGLPVQTDPSSPILVLGDSHTLVFHGGGDMHAIGAGLVDQLAHKSGVSCDLIGVKGSGAGPSRRTLYGKSRKDPEYLSGKKLVIWCFTAREFTESTGIAWRKIPVK